MRKQSSGERSLRHGRRWLTAISATVVLALGAGVQLIASGTAGATGTNFTWKGSSASLTWSSGANWSGTLAPTNSSSIGALTFPTLGSCTGPHACYAGNNDLTGLSATSLSIDSIDGQYHLTGNAVTLGSGGLTATGGTTLTLPIVLGADQTWKAHGVTNYNLEVAKVSGPATLTLDVTPAAGSGSSGVFIGGTSGGTVEVGPVSIVGDGITSTSVAVSSLLTAGATASLNGTDGDTVSTSDVTLAAGGAGTNELGPLSTSHTLLQIGEAAPTPGIVHVDGGVTLAQTSRLSIQVGATGTTPGTDYGELVTTGNVDLTGTSLAVGDVSCHLVNHTGATLTLVTAGTADVTGKFTGLPTGGIVSVEAGSPTCAAGVKIHYTTHKVTGTVVVGAPTALTQATSTTVATRGTLAGTVFPRGSTTTYRFEYGTTTAYGTDVPASPVTVGSTTTLSTASRTFPLTTLTPSTTYHYQIVATNSVGTTYGGDQSFTTAAVGADAPSFTADTPPTTAGAGSTYTYTFAASNGPRYSLVSGAPVFLSITSSTGALTGTVPFSGTSSFAYSVKASNTTGAATVGPFTVTVLPASTVTLATSSSSSAYGQSVTYTATVSGSTGTPTGTVTFTVGSTTLCTGPQTLTSGTATCSTTATPVGSGQTVTASYSGSSTYAPSSGTATITVTKATTTTSVSTTSTSVDYGTTVTYTVTVSPQYSGTPAGAVAVSVGGTQVCTVTLASGAGSCSSASAPAGTGQSITAAYGGDADFAGSTGTASATLTVTVPPPPPPSGTTTSKSATSTSPSGTATASAGNVSAAASGIGSVTVARYSGPPSVGSLSTGTGAYYDVAVGNGSRFTSLDVTVCDIGTGKSLEWWNGTAWAPFSDQSLSGSCITAVVTTSTSPTVSELTGTQVAVSMTPISGNGYWEVAADGGIFAFGTAGFYGSMGGKPLNAPVVGIAPTPNGKGYWEVAADGGIFAFGTAGFYGSMGGKPLNAPVVGIAPTPNGKGYWEVAADGGIFAFGTAGFYGSMGGKPLNAPVVGIAPTPNGKGYWEVAADGGIFAFGTAGFYGSMGGKPLNAPVVGIAPTPNGKGYWEVAADGGIFAFGDAQFYGSMGGKPLNAPVVGIAPTASGQGYWEVAADGGLFAFGGAQFHGSMGGKPLNAPVVGLAPA